MMNRVYMKVAYLLGSLNRGGTETLLLDVFRSADKAPFSFVGIHRKHIFQLFCNFAAYFLLNIQIE